MEKRLFHIISYLELVLKGKMEANPTILGNIQEILNQLPHLHMDKLDLSLYDKTNDINLVYIFELHVVIISRKYSKEFNIII